MAESVMRLEEREAIRYEHAVRCMNALADALRFVRPATHEREVQDAIWTLLERISPGSFEREFALSARERPDFFHIASGVAIEVKVRNGSQSASETVRQCARYAGLEAVRGVLLATTWPHLIGQMPQEIAGIPIRCVMLAGGALG